MSNEDEEIKVKKSFIKELGNMAENGSLNVDNFTQEEQDNLLGALKKKQEGAGGIGAIDFSGLEEEASAVSGVPVLYP